MLFVIICTCQLTNLKRKRAIAPHVYLPLCAADKIIIIKCACLVVALLHRLLISHIYSEVFVASNREIRLQFPEAPASRRPFLLFNFFSSLLSACWCFCCGLAPFVRTITTEGFFRAVMYKKKLRQKNNYILKITLKKDWIEIYFYPDLFHK